ncbi:hypothetical protein LguiA_023338 [Lonicera macranthoides]
MIFPLLVASLILNFSAVDGGRGEALAGGWQPIKDPKDPLVQEIGKFAVTEHNKEAKTNLIYESVIKGETQVVAGTNYRLIISATDGITSGRYQAVVWDKPWEHFRKLTSFKKI